MSKPKQTKPCRECDAPTLKLSETKTVQLHRLWCSSLSGHAPTKKRKRSKQ